MIYCEFDLMCYKDGQVKMNMYEAEVEKKDGEWFCPSTGKNFHLPIPNKKFSVLTKKFDNVIIYEYRGFYNSSFEKVKQMFMDKVYKHFSIWHPFLKKGRAKIAHYIISST